MADRRTSSDGAPLVQRAASEGECSYIGRSVNAIKVPGVGLQSRQRLDGLTGGTKVDGDTQAWTVLERGLNEVDTRGRHAGQSCYRGMVAQDHYQTSD